MPWRVALHGGSGSASSAGAQYWFRRSLAGQTACWTKLSRGSDPWPWAGTWARKHLGAPRHRSEACFEQSDAVSRATKASFTRASRAPAGPAGSSGPHRGAGHEAPEIGRVEGHRPSLASLRTSAAYFPSGTRVPAGFGEGQSAALVPSAFQAHALPWVFVGRGPQCHCRIFPRPASLVQPGPSSVASGVVCCAGGNFGKGLQGSFSGTTPVSCCYSWLPNPSGKHMDFPWSWPCPVSPPSAPHPHAL